MTATLPLFVEPVENHEDPGSSSFFTDTMGASNSKISPAGVTAGMFTTHSES
jgi:hypothetical protein